MADPTTPAIIDTKNVMAAIEQANNLAKVVATATREVVEFGKKLGETFDTVSKNFQEANNSWSKFNTLSKNTTDAMSILATGMSHVTAGVFGASKAFEAFKVGSSASISDVSSQYTVFTDNLSKITPNIKLPPALQGLINKAKDLGSGYFAAAASAQKFKTELLGMYASTGQLNQLLGENGDQLANVDQKMAAMAVEFGNLSTITGYSTEQVAGFAAELGKIPGALQPYEDMKDKTHKASTEMTMLDASMKLASGTGRSYSDVVHNLTTAYDLLNLKGTDALKYHALISEASNKLGMRFDDTREYTQSLAQSFKYFGDNTEGALKVLNRFAPALNASNLSMQASKDLVKEMVSGIEHLTIGTKAFLSARSGGPGGLMGAFQIDKLVREGKLDEVMSMLEKNLKRQMGGRIVTADQAAESPQAAATYMKQLSLVQSGAFGGLVKSEAQAQKLFEAMSKGTNATEALKTGSEALNDTLDKGTLIQNEQKNILSEINSQLTTLISVSAVNAKLSEEQVIGMKNEGVKPYLNSMTNLATKSSMKMKVESSESKQLPMMKIEEARIKALGGLTTSILGFTKTMDAVGHEIGVKMKEIFNLDDKTKKEAAHHEKMKKEVSKDLATGPMPKSALIMGVEESKGTAGATPVGGAPPVIGTLNVETTCINCGEKKVKEIALGTVKGISTAQGGITHINENY